MQVFSCVCISHKYHAWILQESNVWYTPRHVPCIEFWILICDTCLGCIKIFLTKISILSVLKQNIRASINEFGYQSDTSHDTDADTHADSSCITNHDTHGFIDMIRIMIQFFQFQIFRFSGENLRKIRLKWAKKLKKWKNEFYWVQVSHAWITLSIRSGDTVSGKKMKLNQSRIHVKYTCDTRVIHVWYLNLDTKSYRKLHQIV